jgi:hypothetical protein
MAGNVVLRDRGRIFFTFIFDTLGDSKPGGEIVDELAPRVAGPHPLFDMSEDAFCGMVGDLIG